MALATTLKKSTFAGIVRKNPETLKNKIEITAPSYYQDWINRNLVEGEKVSISVEGKRAKRTVSQNSYYFGVYLPLIAQETGEDDIEGLHELFKGKFLDRGVKKILGENVRKKGSTTELSVGGFVEYIMNIEKLTGVPAPDTEEWFRQNY